MHAGTRPGSSAATRADRGLHVRGCEISCSTRKKLRKWSSLRAGDRGSWSPVTDVLDSPVRTAELLHAPDSPDAAWWRNAVIYQIYPRSFADADGDGIGDLPGITARLPYLKALGVDAVWSRPFYRSPQDDAGYDVADYRDVDPLFGTLADVDAMLAAAHDLGLKVIVDLVPNHTSDEHAWFQAALAAGPGQPRARALHLPRRAGRGRRASRPTTGSRSSAARLDPRHRGRRHPGQWYLHIFDSTQPDFNWEHPEVRAEFDGDPAVLARPRRRRLPRRRRPRPHQGAGPARLERGPAPARRGPPRGRRAQAADVGPGRRARDLPPAGARCSTPTASPTASCAPRPGSSPQERAGALRPPRRDAPGVQLRLPRTRLGRRRPPRGHRVLARRPPTRSARPTHLGAVQPRRRAARLAARPRPVGAQRPNGISAAATRSPTPSSACAAPARRPRSCSALPGGAYLYQGEELGLPDSHDMPDEFRQDPTFRRTNGEEIGRDGCRVPMPWAKDAPSFGFGPAEHTVAAPARRLRRLRRRPAGRRRGLDPRALPRAAGHPTRPRPRHRRPPLRRGLRRRRRRVRATPAPATTGSHPRRRQPRHAGRGPAGGRAVLVASGPLDGDGRVPADTAVWATH